MTVWPPGKGANDDGFGTRESNILGRLSTRVETNRGFLGTREGEKKVFSYQVGGGWGGGGVLDLLAIKGKGAHLQWANKI